MRRIYWIIMNKNKRLASVYVLPPGSKPIVRVECPEQSIEAQRLFKLCCDTIQLYESSRRFFGLFRGLLHPVKKYGDSELIMLPVKTYPISIQKWSFDITQECRLIKTDPIAIRLLALQYKCDLEMKRKHPTSDQLNDLRSFEDPEFTCYKQYLDCARRILDYTWTVVLGVEVVQKVKLVTNILQKGSKVDLACTPKKLIIIGRRYTLLFWVTRICAPKSENRPFRNFIENFLMIFSHKLNISGILHKAG